MFKGLKFGVAWIGDNDDPDQMDLELIDGTISVALLADLTGKDSSTIALKVLRYRQARDGVFADWSSHA